MERILNIQLAVCPACAAVCECGHDEDGQIFCAKCQKAFRPRETKLLTKREYDILVSKAEERFERSGWIAYTATID